jgi:alpha-glucosidase
MNTILKSTVVLLLAIFCCGFISSAQLVNAGKVVSYKKIPGGISGKTEHGIFEVAAYSEHIIRVRVSKNVSFNELPYSLVNTRMPFFTGATINEDKNHILLSTGSIDLVIEKSPVFRVVFKNKNGTVLNEDVKGSAFGTTFIGEKVSVYKTLHEGERFVGMGEALGNLDRRGTGITLNNTDTYKYGDPRLPMYTNVPFYIGIHHQNVYGVFYNNSFKGFFNFGVSTPGFISLNMEGGDADYFFMYDSSVAKIIEHYTSLTGRMQMPPLWSLGYQQSRCTYYPQEKVEWIAESFRKKRIPLDGIVLDADYQLGYQPFRVNKNRFPDMPGLAAKLAKMNIELTASVYPGVKTDSSYESYTDGLKKDVFIKYADGSLFETEIAPLKCLLPDYTNPKSRSWWMEKMKWLPANGIHGYWNDMNEPAVGGSYLPDNLLFDFDGRKAGGLEAKNVYGFQMARSSFEAALKNDKTRRPFILTRSGFAGVQRYSAVWSGDNTSNNEGLLTGVLLNSQLGLSGISFCGYDVGGYIGDASKDLYKRWIELGVFSPYCRNHREFFGAAGEPWAYGEEAEAISLAFIELRYRMMPYTYSAVYEATQSGLPVARSLCINYPFDDKVYDNNYQYQFLYGDALMVVPVTSLEKQKKIFLPKGEWYNLYSDERLTGDKEINEDVPLYKLPVYVKAASVIPMQSIIQSTKEKPSDTLVLHVFNGNDSNSFVYYEDGGDGFEYREKNFCKRRISLNPTARQLVISKQEGVYNSNFKKLKLVFHGFDDISKLNINKAAGIQPVSGEERILDPLKYLDDIYDPAMMKQLRDAEMVKSQKIITIENSSEEIVIRW